MRCWLSLACVVFASCGGPGGGGNGNKMAGDPSVSSSCGDSRPTTGGFRLSVRSQDEVEPNDDLSTAFAASLPVPAAPEDRVGFVVEGDIHDTTDRDDVIAFTSSRTHWFFIKLCESTCNTDSENDWYGNPDSLIAWVAHFRVLDADGRTIINTQLDNPLENYAEVCVDAGVVTYISIHANNTVNARQPYRMSAIEMAL